MSLTGANATDFIISGITFPKTILPDSIVTFSITCNSSVAGIKNAEVHVNYSNCVPDDYNFMIKANVLVPVLYSYPASSVIAGGNTTIIPSTPAYGIQTLTAVASNGFSGILTADPLTGNIRVTNAKPAGTYTITVYPTTTSSQSFTLTVTNPVCSPAYFDTPAAIQLSFSPTSLAIGDFNNDSNQDIMVAGDIIGSVYIYSGNGNGGFNYTNYLYLNTYLRALAVGDFNSDGKLDLATTNDYTSQVYINLGDGTGNFGPAHLANVGLNPIALAVADFNSDGFADIACTNYGDDNVSILLGNGAGDFTSAPNVSVGNGPTSIAVGDFNSDGKLDIATTSNNSQSVSIRLGNGTGGFTGSTNIAFSYAPTFITLGYFNNDNILDFAVSILNTNSVAVRYGDGTGNFTGTTEMGTNYSPRAISAGDFNGDGKQDLAVSCENGPISLFIGNGLGNFSDGVSINAYSNNSNLACGDFNEDGILDLAGTTYYNGLLSIFTGQTKGINLQGNITDIPDGSTSISSTNNTDFGNVPVGVQITKSFAIRNKGAAPLTVNSFSITGTNAGNFSIPGNGFPTSVFGGGEADFNVSFLPTTVGTKSATIHVNYADCSSGDYDFAVGGNGVVPTLGNYSPVTVISGGDTIVIPSSAPTGTPILFATTSSKFKGVLTADPVTGLVKIVNAKPAGTYTVSVKAGSVVKTFILTVTNPVCSQAAFSGLMLSTDYGVNSPAIGDFNNDGKQDFVCANFAYNQIRVDYGDGSGGLDTYNYIYLNAQTSSVAVADFNGDGLQDIVTADFDINRVSVNLNTGFYSFINYPDVSVGLKPMCVATGDFNNDGRPDIATANYNANTVSIRLGDGNGNFTGSTEVNVGAGPNYIATGDFNNDGNTDFATANYLANTVSIRLGNGAGGFSITATVNVGVNPNCIAIGDFNNDGRPDFATANYINGYSTNTASVRLGNGSGGFTGTTELNSNYSAQSIAVGDFNGDGKLDIATANPNDYISLFMGNGSGGFGSFVSLIPYNINNGLVVGDLNNDGIHDIVTTFIQGNTILLGKRSGISITGNSDSIFDGSTTPSQINNTDFGLIPVSYSTSRAFAIRNDGAVSLVVNSISITGTDAANFSVGGITLPLTVPAASTATFRIACNSSSTGIKSARIHVNNTECTLGDYDFSVQAFVAAPSLGTYQPVTLPAGGNATVTPLAAPTNVTSLFVTTTSSFNGILIVNPATGVVSITDAKPAGVYLVTVRSGNAVQTFTLTVTNPDCSQGTFLNPVDISTNPYPFSLAVGDFNNDGHQDFVISDNYGGNLSLKLGNGSGGFSGTTSIYSGDNFYGPLVVGDINGDGNQDIAYCSYYTNKIVILLGDGLGSFSKANEVTVSGNPVYLILDDFNNDGKLDFASLQGSSVSVRLGDGTGSFSGTTEITSLSGSESILSGDFNNDGKRDLAIPNSFTSNVFIRLGDGLGNFSGTTSVNVGVTPLSIALGDFNNDGKQDFAVANLSSTFISVRLGDGLGGFTNAPNVNVAVGPSRIMVGDFNGDGNQDLATNSVLVLYGNGTGNFTPNTNIPMPPNVISLAVGDFNEDKLEDIITSNNVVAPDSTSFLYLGAANEINITGNSNNIIDGSTSVSPTNNTDFGTITSNTPVIKNYIIQNSGFLPLTISSITKTGVNPSEFVVSGISLPIILPSGGSTTFNITFTPVVSGIRSAVIHINNDDCNEGDYDFVVQGNVLFPPVFNFCPVNLNQNAVNGFCKKLVTYTATATGNPTPVISYEFSGVTIGTGSGSGSNSFFNTGTTHVKVTATNAGGTTTCEFNITITSNIDDNNVCTIDACNTQSGAITHVNISTDDNNVCTIDNCNSVSGVFHTPVNTDDNNVCTIDMCNSVSGITHTTIDFNDNNACTLDACNSVTGPSYTLIDTDDNNACTNDGCNTVTGIFHNAINTDDGNVCTDDGCNTLTGVFHKPVFIDDNNACTKDGCDSATGIYHNTLPVVDDNNPCTTDGCDSSNGEYHTNVADGSPGATDNNVCTSDVCENGMTVHNTIPIIDDNNPCTADGCDSSGGEYHHNVADGSPGSDDNNVCTADVCENGITIHNTLPILDDNNPCTIDGCDPLSGAYFIDVANGSPGEDDNNVCTSDVCENGITIHNTLPVVDDNNPCTTDGCDPSSRRISYECSRWFSGNE